MGILDSLRSGASRPIRRALDVFSRHDPRAGKTTDLPTESRETLLSSDGSIDTVTVRHPQFLDCGHSIEVPIGGRCLECGSLSCATCHDQCSGCRRPLCLSCTRIDQVQGQEAIKWCSHCVGPERRKRRWRKIKMTAIRPFIESTAEDSRRP